MYPYILVSLALTIIFVLCCHGAIKKHPGAFYALAVLIVIAEVVYYQTGIRDLAPEWVTRYVVNLFKRGALSTAMFVVVMYAGALDGRRPVVRTLMGVRGQLSILACILTLGHNIIYGLKHFVHLFTNPWDMKPQTATAAVLSLVMIALMLPLMATSFRCVRTRMKAVHWKRLQRLAYMFFSLIYIHVMVLFLPKFGDKYLDILFYTAIFGNYLLLRVSKSARRKEQMPVGCACRSVT
ncbi:hypothetical protein [uncultured Intestinimonas sp.]|uniref:hypothetical protein n=1 Tax=uncultured Intestinimonas sp. TaxID=1689265 RepID=UPI0025D0590C|nr:hypothetical protein [uncultured Intestinimonas sp.]